MKKHTKIYLSLALIMVAGLMIALAGCKPKGGEEGKKEAAGAVKEYKIGAILSVTGKASFLGDPEKKTLEMLEADINKKGGINGVPVKIIIEDDQGDENIAKTAAMKLIDKDGVLAIIGPSQSGTSMAIIDIADSKKVPLISCAAAEAIVNPVKEWVFKTPQKDSYVAELILGQMKKDGITNIAMFSDNSGFGQGGDKQIKAFADKYGVKLVIDESYDAKGATKDDLSTLLTKVKADSKIQAVINWSITPSQTLFPVLMKQLDMSKIKLFQSHGFGNIKYVKAAGDAANGVVFPAGRLLVADALPDSNPQKKTLVDYKTEYEKTYGEDVSTFGGHAYDAFWLIVKAIEKAGADKAKIRDEIENTQSFPGTGGIFNMSKTDHNGLTIDSLEMLTVKDGKFALLNEAK